MSETVTGILQEITSRPGKSAKGKSYVLYGVVVDGDKYGTKFDKVKAAVGDTVEFDWEENDRGYNDVVDGTFRVTKKATGAESAATSKANTESAGSKQDSIERQVILKEASAITIAMIAANEGFDPLAFIPKAFTALSAAFSGGSKPAAGKAKPVAAKKPEAEEEDEIPY